MGNCQAIDAATLVIQHPNGKVDKFYSPLSSSHVMKTNPGHYVALLISTTLCPTNKDSSVRVTRIKLLKPTDTLALGQVYRLVTTQEVMKGLREKQKAKMRQNVPESAHHKPDLEKEKKVARRSEMEDNKVNTKPESGRSRITAPTNNGGTAKTRFWQPSLQSISEAAS